MQQYDSFSQLEAFGDATPGTVLNNSPVVNANNQPQVIKPTTLNAPNVVQGATIANKNTDQVTLETDDGFFNIKATGEAGPVSRVFEKLQSSMGATKLPSPTQAQGSGGTTTRPATDVANAANAANAAKEAAVDAKLKAKEDELEKKKKVEEEKLATDKKKAQ